MDERRQLPRWQVKKEAKVWLSQAQEFSHCIIEDINLKGMCVSFSKRLTQEHVVNMSIDFDGNFNLTKIGVQIPWMKEAEGRYVYGLSFNNIRDWDKDKIDQYINKHCYDQVKQRWWGNNI